MLCSVSDVLHRSDHRKVIEIADDLPVPLPVPAHGHIIYLSRHPHRATIGPHGPRPCARRLGMFRLHKRYLDVVTDEGHVLIAYAARLRWRRLRLSYAAALHSPPAGPAREGSDFGRVIHPQLQDDVVTWEHASLKLSGAGNALPQRCAGRSSGAATAQSGGHVPSQARARRSNAKAGPSTALATRSDFPSYLAGRPNTRACGTGVNAYAARGASAAELAGGPTPPPPGSVAIQVR